MRREPAISRLVNFINSGLLSLRHSEDQAFGVALRDAWPRAESPGQLYFLLGVTKFSLHEKEVAEYIVRLLRDIRAYPYHVQLELIDFAQYLYDVEEPYRGEIIEALEASLNKLGIMMNSIIIEALKAFGALDKEEGSYIQVIRNEIEDALGTDSSGADLAAWSLFSCQFDHPFDSAYCEEIQGLDDPRKKLLFTKACRGANVPHLSFLGTLIRELSKFNDSNVAPAIARWTGLPDKQYFMPQEALEVFISAHEALGHLGADLPRPRGGSTTPAENALLACGELFYWANRADVRDPERSTYSEGARSILLDHSKCASAGALYLTSSRMLCGTHISLVKVYPDLCVSICSEALERWDDQVSFFKHGFRDEAGDIACFAIQVLGNAGGIDHLRNLRRLCDHERLSASSLKAIKKIEERVLFRND